MPPGVHPGSRMAELAELISELNHPQLALALDTGHANLVSSAAGETLQAGALLATTHVHDNNGRQDAHEPPGHGKINWAEWGRALDSIGYRGPILLECIRHIRQNPSSFMPEVVAGLVRSISPRKLVLIGCDDDRGGMADEYRRRLLHRDENDVVRSIKTVEGAPLPPTKEASVFVSAIPAARSTRSVTGRAWGHGRSLGFWSGRSPLLSPTLNRREVLASGGAVGAAAAVLSTVAGNRLEAGVELGRFARRPGVQGRMTGAPGGGRGTGLSRRAVRVRHSGGADQRALGRIQSPRRAVLASRERIIGQRDGRCLGPSDRRGRCLFRRAGSGPDQCHDGHRRGLAGQHPDRRDRRRRRSVASGAQIGQVHGLNNAAILRPIVKALFEVRHQAEIPGAIFQAFQVAMMRRAGSRGGTDSLSSFHAKSGITITPVPPPCPFPFDEAAYGRVLARLMDRRRRVGIYAGLGCVDNGGGTGRRSRDAPGSGGDIGQRQRGIADSPPVGGWVGLRQARDARLPRRAFKDVDLVLAVGVRYSEVSTAYYAIPRHDNLDPCRCQPPESGAKRAGPRVTLCRDSPNVFRPAARRRGRQSRRPACPDAVEEGFTSIAKGRSRARAVSSPDRAVRRPDVFLEPVPVRPGSG